MSNPTVLQSATVSTDNGAVQPVFGSTPTTGNLVVQMLWIGTVSALTTANGWTILDHKAVSGAEQVVILYRYVQGGDTTTLPTCTTDTSDRQASVAWEIEFAGATWADSFDQDECETPTPGATNSITPLTTGSANELALVFGGGYHATSPPSPSVGAPFTQDQAFAGFEQYVVGGHNSYASSSSSVSATITWGGTTPTYAGLATLLIKPPVVAPSGAIAQTLTRISQSAGSNSYPPGHLGVRVSIMT